MTDDTFSASLYFVSGQDAICNDDSCNCPSGSSNKLVQRGVHLLRAVAYPAQWNYEDDVCT